MMRKRPNPDLIRWALMLVAMMIGGAAWGQNVILHLRNGDRIAGTILSETTNQVTLSTVWIKELVVPVAQIERRELPPAQPPAVVTPPAINNAALVNAATPSVKAKPASPPPPWYKNWHGDASVGADMVYGATDRQIYYGKVNLTYARPFASDPKQF